MISKTIQHLVPSTRQIRFAGSKGGPLEELISPFLQRKMDEAKKSGNKEQLEALERMYKYDEMEGHTYAAERHRHFESGVTVTFEGTELQGVERLYKRTVLIEPTMCCAAHCRSVLNAIHLPIFFFFFFKFFFFFSFLFPAFKKSFQF